MGERIRAARSDEAEALTALARRSKASWGYPAELMERFAPDLVIGADAIARGEVRVVEDDAGAVLGVARLSLTGEVAVLEDLWIEPAAMGRGLGRRLWEDAVERARRAGAIAIELDADPYAKPFYDRMGAVQVGETPSTRVAGRSLPRMRFDLR